MSVRMQILVPEGLGAQVRRAAQRARLSRGAWVRRAIERAIADDRPAADPLAKLSGLGAPTGDIDRMLAQIKTGRG